MYPTRPFDLRIDSYLIVNRATIARFPQSSATNLRVLTEDGARQLWQDVVSRRGKFIPRLVPKGHWSHEFFELGPDWIYAWNRWITSGDTTPLSEIRCFLRDKAHFPQTAKVFFILSGTLSLEMEWEFFIEHWEYFLHTDDGLFLVTRESLNSAYFGENGLLGIARRRLSPRFDEFVENGGTI